MRMAAGLEAGGRIAHHPTPFNSQEQQYEQRFAALHNLSRPEPLSYWDFSEAVLQSGVPELAACIQHTGRRPCHGGSSPVKVRMCSVQLGLKVVLSTMASPINCLFLVVTDAWSTTCLLVCLRQQSTGITSADVGRQYHSRVIGLPPWQMRCAWLFDNVGMCVSSVVRYEQLLLACTLRSARGCPGSTCISPVWPEGVILSLSAID